MQQILAQTLQALNAISPQTWAVIVSTIVAAATTSPLMVGIKKWLSVDSEKKMLFLVMLGSMVSAAFAWVIAHAMHVPQFAAWIILVQGWLAFATTQPVFFYGVKPIFAGISVWFEGKVAAAAAAANEAKAAAVPANGMPLDAAANAHDDFSGR